MALAKSSASILSAVTTTQTSSAVDISASYESTVYVSIAQSGGTASSAATFQVQFSPDGGTTYYNGPTYSAGTAVGTYYWLVAVPDDTTHIKVAYTQPGSNTGTCTAQVGKVTGV